MKKKLRRLKKKIYIGLVSSTVIVLAIVRCVDPSVVRVYQPETQEVLPDSVQKTMVPLTEANELPDVDNQKKAYLDSFSMSSKLLYLAHKPTRFVNVLLRILWGGLSRTVFIA